MITKREIHLVPDTKELCKVCHKRKATRQCDCPKGHIQDVGHSLNGGAPREWIITCDRLMCDECAVHIVGDIDFCPMCVQLIKTKEKESRK